jgi:hypothetical protein
MKLCFLKNPKADLSKNSPFYFLIGLIVVLVINSRALELKTYERSMMSMS